MVDEIFGDMLFRPNSKHMKEFCSPESLKGKILISTKPPVSLENQDQKVQEEEVERLEKRDEISRFNDNKVKTI